MADRWQGLEQAATNAKGLRYDSPAARAILDNQDLDWSGVWPLVDRQGLITGGITEGDDGEMNVDDMAMILASDARGLRRPDDDYDDGCVDLGLPPIGSP